MITLNDDTKSIYDDVATLQEEVANLKEVDTELLASIASKLSGEVVNLNNADLNEQIGKILFGYGNACVNRPTTQNGYLINIPHNSGPNEYGKQIWITRPSNNVFIRNLEAGVWGDWAYAYYDSGWRELPLATGVTAHNATNFPCRYRRIGDEVFIEGCIKGFAEVEKVVATIPDGYRPAKPFYMQGATNGGNIDTYNVQTNGNIQRVATTLPSGSLSVDNYHFINMNYLVN